jgi:pimeloyl-ACP methyl ester carboxylesterase
MDDTPDDTSADGKRHLKARMRPAKALIHDAVDATTWLVSEGHESTARLALGALESAGLGEPARAVDGVRRAITEGVLGSVRAVNRGVEGLSDAALDLSEVEQPPEPAVPLRSDALISVPGAVDQLVGALNGAVGDHLASSKNGLDLGMRLRHRGRWLPRFPRPEDLPGASSRAVVLVHGLATTELSWSLEAESALGDAGAHYGGMLEHDLGFTPIYARYNTGLPLAETGRMLAEVLEALIERWPVPLEELVLVGHSMGGLVSRAASRFAVDSEQAWVGRLSHMVCLGTPHGGAPLARVGHSAAHILQEIELPATRILGRILSHRSEGVKDLRHVDHRATGPLLDHVRYLFVAGTVGPELPAHPSTDWLGDLLVPVDSATGPEGDRVRIRRFEWVAHHQLQVNAGVYEAIRQRLAAP